MKKTFAACLTLLLCIYVNAARAQVEKSSVRGKIIEEATKKPLEGVTVEIKNSNYGPGYFKQVTDKKGIFSFQDVPAGTRYDFTAYREGYCDYELNRWEISSYQQSIELLIPMIKAAGMSGRITTSGGLPVHNAQVQIERSDYGNRSNTAYTGEDGTYKFTGLLPSKYEMRVEHSEYSYETVSNLELKSGECRQQNIVLYKPASISGTVMVEDIDQPARGITITARGPRPMTAVTAHDGSYYAGDLKPGRYMIESDSEGILPFRFRTPLEVPEGQEIKDVNFSVKLKQPELHLVVNRRVFLPEDSVSFDLRCFRTSEVNFAVYRVPRASILSNEWKQKIAEGKFEGFEKVKEWTHQTKNFHPYRWIYNTVGIDEKLPEGVYVIDSSFQNYSSREVFYVTTLGIVCKRDSNGILVYATHLKENRPLDGVRVYILPERNDDRNNLLGYQFKEGVSTDGNGTAMINVNPYADCTVVGIGSDNSVAVAPSWASSTFQREREKIYIYTDRPVYRPSHRVYFKGILRDALTEATAAVKGENVSVSVNNPDGDKVYSKNLTTNAFGSVNGFFDIPGDARFGRYRIEMSGAGTNTEYFDVEEYRKPEFKVDVETDKPFYTSGDEIRFKVNAEYYFGAPVVQSKVRFRIYETKINLDEYAGWWERNYADAGYTKLVKTGEIRTDMKGLAGLIYKPDRQPYDRNISIEVEVTDPSNRVVTEKKTATMGRGQFCIKIKPGRYVYSQKDWVSVRVGTFDFSDNPVSRKVNIRILQDVWNQVFNTYTTPSRPVATAVVETDAKGWGTVTFKQLKETTGRMQVYCYAADDMGNKISTSSSMWIYGGYDETYSYNYQGMELIPDRDTYREGETARIIVNTPYPEDFFMLTVEGKRIFEHRVIRFNGKTKILEVPVKKEYAPQVEVRVSCQHEKDLITRSATIKIPVEGKKLTIEAAADREKYHPGEKGTFRIKTLDENGKPVSAEVSVAVVDEAIFAIRPDHTQDIYNYFYQRPANWVYTSYSYPITYLAGASKEARPPIRKNFRDTALWLPEVTTDGSGEASVPIEYPDNLTTWRATIIGNTGSTLVGSKRMKTLVTKELIARLEIPRFFVEGDTVNIVGVVNNNTGENMNKTATTLEAENRLKVLSSRKEYLDIPAGSSNKNYWKTEVLPGVGDAEVTLTAAGKNYSDAVLQKAPVRSFGVNSPVMESGRFSDAGKEITLSPPAGEYTAENMEVSVSPSLAGMCLSSMNYLATYPYGCIEQVINSFLPNLYLLKSLKTLGISRPEFEEGLGARINTGLQKIYGAQNGEGGWGWWGRDETNYYISAYAVYCLYLAKECGYSINTDSYRRGVDALKNFLHKTHSWDMESYILFVLSEAGEKDDVIAGELYSNLDKLNGFSCACLASSLSNYGDTEKAQKVLKALLDTITVKKDVAYWEPAYGQKWGWPGGSVEITARGLTALRRCGYSGDYTDRIIRYLANSRVGNRWRSTKETATVILALSEYMEKAGGGELAPDYALKIYVNNSLLENVRINRDNMFDKAALSFVVPKEKLKAGENRLKFTKEGTGTVYYSARLNGLVTGKTIGAKDYGRELKIKKEYLRASMVRDHRGNPYIMTEPLKEGESLKPGDEIMVKVSVESEIPFEYMMLEDALPGGFEVSRENTNIGGGYWWKPYSYMERHDEEMVYFLRRLEKGKTEISYLIRAELPGRFRVIPAYISAMYSPDIFAYTDSASLEVGE